MPRFLIDTGSELNIIKQSLIKPNLFIDRKTVYNLAGISEGLVLTQGCVRINIDEGYCRMNVVPDSFPIEADGILGIEFLKEQEATLSFRNDALLWGNPRETAPFVSHDVLYLPARTKTLVKITINKPNRFSGYLPKINAGPGIFIGECLVTSNNGRASLFAINSTSENVSLILPPVELESYDSTIRPIRVIKLTDEPEAKTNLQVRINKITEMLDLKDLDPLERDSIEKLISEFPCQFHLPNDKLSKTSKITHKIPTTDNVPINVKQYRYPPHLRDIVQKQVQELIDNDIVEESESPYNSPLWIVPKKPDAQGNKRWRLVIDFRALNEKTVASAYPLPNITEILDQLGRSKYFSTLDLASGFHQVPIDPADAPKTAFSTPFNHLQYKRMPMGLKGAPSTFQALMDKVLTGLQGIELFVYMDDIVVYAESLEDHSRKLKKLFGRLKTAGLTLQPEKCLFLKKEVVYLGHVISEQGVRPDPRKTQAVSDFPRPINAKNIKQFLGLAGYYRRFIPDFAKIARPLHYLLQKEIKFIWGETQESAFVTLKQKLCSQPLLQYPDFNSPFVVTTDASDFALGGVLSQGPIGKDLPIAYTSRALINAEFNYTTTEKELLAIIHAVKQFRPYLYGRKFTLVTDHRPLLWLHRLKDPVQRIARWKILLREYDYDIIHKPGKINMNADALSRNPVTTYPVPSNPENLGSEEPFSEMEIENVFLINKTELISGRQGSEGAENSKIPHTFTDTDNGRTDKGGLSTASSFEESSGCTYTVAEVAKRCRSRGSRLMPSTDEESSIRETPVACISWPKIPLGDVNVGGVPVVKSTTDALAHAGGRGPTGKFLSRNPDGRSTLACVEESAGGLQENSYQETLSGDCIPAVTTETEVLECAEGVSEGSTFAHGKKDRAGDLQENSYQEIPSGKNRVPIMQTEVQRVIAPREPTTDDELTNDKTQDESVSDVDVEVKIVAIKTCQIKCSIDPVDSNPVLNESHEKALTMNDDQMREKPYIDPSQLAPSKDDPILAAPNNPERIFIITPVQYSRDQLLMRKDNIAHFMSVDCEISTPILQQLVDLEMIDIEKLKNEPIGIGAIVQTKLSTGKIIYSVFVKEKSDEIVTAAIIVQCLDSLRTAMIEEQIKSVSISKIGDGLEKNHWLPIEITVRARWKTEIPKLTICTGEVVIPRLDDRLGIISEAHDSAIGGHKGIAKTYHRVRERYFWPRIKEDISEYVRTCADCQKRKLVRVKTRQPMRITTTPNGAFEVLEMDIVGPLPVTVAGNKYILTLQCNLTKYSDALPIFDMTAEMVATALVHDFITRFGCPEVIKTDQGSNFQSSLMQKVAKIFKIKQLRSTSFHPQTMGSLERSHHSLAEYLKMYTDKTDWDTWIKMAMFSYNTSVHSAHGFTPHELVFGQKARLPSEFETRTVGKTYEMYLDELIFKLNDTQKMAKTRLLEAKERSKRYYDQKLNAKDFEIGEEVYLLKEPRIGKFDDQYAGRYKIMELIGDRNAKIDLGNNKIKVVHFDKLKHACLRPT